MSLSESPFHRRPPPRARTRREFLWESGGGLGGLALASLLSRTDASAVQPQPLDARPHPPFSTPHFPAKAKRIVHLFMAGAASHLEGS